MSEGYGTQLLATPISESQQIVNELYAYSGQDDDLLGAPQQQMQSIEFTPLHHPQPSHHSPQPVTPAHDSFSLSPQTGVVGVPDSPAPALWQHAHPSTPTPAPDPDSFSLQGAVLERENGEHLHGLDTPQGFAEELDMDEPMLAPNAYPAVYALGVPGVPVYAPPPPPPVYHSEGPVTPHAHPVALPQQNLGSSASSLADSADGEDVEMDEDEDVEMDEDEDESEVEAMVTPPPSMLEAGEIQPSPHHEPDELLAGVPMPAQVPPQATSTVDGQTANIAWLPGDPAGDGDDVVSSSLQIPDHFLLVIEGIANDLHLEGEQRDPYAVLLQVRAHIARIEKTAALGAEKNQARQSNVLQAFARINKKAWQIITSNTRKLGGFTGRRNEEVPAYV